MSSFQDKLNIDDFSVLELKLDDIDEISTWLSNNSVTDINIAEQGLIKTLAGQNLCQELIAKIDRWIGHNEIQKNKAWAKAALDKATVAGQKAVKNREWFAMSDDDYVSYCNEINISKASRKWLENKVNFFSGWHYAFKTFLKRDYVIETGGNFQASGYNTYDSTELRLSNDNGVEDEYTGEEINWK